jgi:hypothetical protein
MDVTVATQTLLDTLHVEVCVLPGNVVRIVRKGSAPASAGVQEVWGGVEPAVSGLKRSAHGLLVDVRSARGRNDPEFENAFEPLRKRLTQGWRRVARG